MRHQLRRHEGREVVALRRRHAPPGGLLEAEAPVEGRGAEEEGGPFTIAARREMLAKLLKVQAAFGEELISQDEIDLIKRIWTEDLINTYSRNKNEDGNTGTGG